jgi:hypothetical protein
MSVIVTGRLFHAYEARLLGKKPFAMDGLAREANEKAI